MARKSKMQKAMEAALNEQEPQIRAAFEEAIRDIKSQAQISVIIEALKLGDIPGAIRAVGISPEAFQGIDRAIERAYIAGGAATVSSLPAVPDPLGTGRLNVRFDGRNPRAEAWLNTHSSQKIVAISNEQRTMVQQVLEASVARGDNPRTAALDVVGRLNKATGLREGGIIGLSPPQLEYVKAAKLELSSSEPQDLEHYLTRTRRDRRYDATVKKAILNKKALPKETARKIAQRYEDRLLVLRGETVARTEALGSLHAGQDEGLTQVMEKGQVRPEQVVRVWRTAFDPLVRESHSRINGQKRAKDEPFDNGLRHPGDPRGSAAEIINCRCTLDIRFDYIAGLRPNS